MKIEIGKKYRHLEYGFIGTLVTIDNRISNGCIIEVNDGVAAIINLPDGTVLNFPAPVIRWTGPKHKIEELFDEN